MLIRLEAGLRAGSFFAKCFVGDATLVTSSKALFSTKYTQDLCIHNLLTIISIPEETSGVVFVHELVSTDTHVGSTSKLVSTDTRVEMSVL